MLQKISKTLFWSVFILYSICVKILSIIQWAHREFTTRYFYGNSEHIDLFTQQSEKLIKIFGSLKKIPQKVILSIKLTNNLQERICRLYKQQTTTNNNEASILLEDIGNQIMGIALLLQALKIKQIVICISGLQNQTLETLQSQIDKLIQQNYVSTANINKINCKKYYKQLNQLKITKYPNKSLVPLIICMNNYKGLNALPFSQLIDAEFVFCPNLINDRNRKNYQKQINKMKNYHKNTIYEIYRCLEQYGASVQRHGK